MLYQRYRHSALQQGDHARQGHPGLLVLGNQHPGRDAARKEAEITISDAELQAEKIVQGAHARFLRIVDDINELKRQRVQFETNVRTLAESHLKLIEAMRDPAREEAVQYVPSRKRAAEE